MIWPVNKFTCVWLRKEIRRLKKSEIVSAQPIELAGQSFAQIAKEYMEECLMLKINGVRYR